MMQSRDEPHPQPSAVSVSNQRPLDVGIVVAGQTGAAEIQSIRAMRDRLTRRLQEDFGEFRWRLTLVNRAEALLRLPSSPRVEPVELLEVGQSERESHRWDFILIVTQAELRTHYKPFAVGIVSRVHDAAILSTSRLDPRSETSAVQHEGRIAAMSERLVALALHALGHLNGLGHSDEPQNVMYELVKPSDLASMQLWSAEQKADVAGNLRLIADVRLEEQADAGRTSATRFYARGAWVNRHEILDAVLQAHPWEFPQRLGRLTTAAFSTVLVLLMTAETWDLASNVTAGQLAGLLAVALCVTTAFVAVKQRLLVRRARRLTEQTVVANVAAVTIVLSGMLTTFFGLLGTTLAFQVLVFRTSVVKSWAISLNEPWTFSHSLVVASFVAAMGLVIGAFGASFEEYNYFRHIAFVDEET
ncbi:MAG: matrixin family metalloprotease [Maioricimonas sp. JB049]